MTKGRPNAARVDWGKDRAWTLRAACRTEDPELFFVEDERGRDVFTKYPQAKAVCDRCPVRLRCREVADDLEGRTVTKTHVHGVWGGETPTERIARRVRERRRSG